MQLTFEVLEQLLLDGVHVHLFAQTLVVGGVEGAVHLSLEPAGCQRIRVHAREAPDQLIVVPPVLFRVLAAVAEDVDGRQDVVVGGVPFLHLHPQPSRLGRCPRLAVHLGAGHGLLPLPGLLHGPAHMPLRACRQGQEQ